MKTFDPVQHLHITTSVQKAIGSELYIFFTTDADKLDDWRADNCIWHPQGANKATPSKEPVLMKSYWWGKDANNKKRTVLQAMRVQFKNV